MTKEEAKEYLKRYSDLPDYFNIQVLKMAEPKIENTHIAPIGETILETYTVSELKKIAND